MKIDEMISFRKLLFMRCHHLRSKDVDKTCILVSKSQSNVKFWGRISVFNLFTSLYFWRVKCRVYAFSKFDIYSTIHLDVCRSRWRHTSVWSFLFELECNTRYFGAHGCRIWSWQWVLQGKILIVYFLLDAWVGMNCTKIVRAPSVTKQISNIKFYNCD